MLRKVIDLHFSFLTVYNHAPPPTQNQRCKLAAMLLSTQLAYHRGLWCHPGISCGNRSFKDNKTRLPTGIVNTLQHTLVPQSSIGSVESPNLDRAQVGTTVTHTHTALWNGEKGGQLHRGSQDATSQTSAACCMTRVGTEWELVHCVCVCVCDYDWIFLGRSLLVKTLLLNLSSFPSQFSVLPCHHSH